MINCLSVCAVFVCKISVFWDLFYLKVDPEYARDFIRI